MNGPYVQKSFGRNEHSTAVRPRKSTAITVIVLLLVASSGCTGTSTSEATPRTDTTTEHARHLWIEYAGPDQVAVRLVVEEYQEGGQQVLNETMTLHSGERRSFEHHLQGNATYYVTVETPNDTASVTLRDYNGVTFAVDGDGSVERNLEFD